MRFCFFHGSPFFMVFQFGITQFDDLAVVQGDFFDLFAVDISSSVLRSRNLKLFPSPVSMACCGAMSGSGSTISDFRAELPIMMDGKPLRRNLSSMNSVPLSLPFLTVSQTLLSAQTINAINTPISKPRMIIPKALLAAVLLILLRSTSSSKPPKQPPSKPPTALFQTCEPLR